LATKACPVASPVLCGVSLSVVIMSLSILCSI